MNLKPVLDLPLLPVDRDLKKKGRRRGGRKRRKKEKERNKCTSEQYSGLNIKRSPINLIEKRLTFRWN